MVVKVGDGPGQQKRFWSIPHYPESGRWQGTREEALEELGALLKDAGSPAPAGRCSGGRLP